MKTVLSHQQRAVLRHGFTLIELLVVISIIALLIAILLPALGKARQGARTMLCGTQIRQLALGVEMYRADHDDYYMPIMGWGPQRYWSTILSGYINTTVTPNGLARNAQRPSA